MDLILSSRLPALDHHAHHHRVFYVPVCSGFDDEELGGTGDSGVEIIGRPSAKLIFRLPPILAC